MFQDSIGPSHGAFARVPHYIDLSRRFQRVLVVDDSKLNRKMLSRQLKDHFLEVVEVSHQSPSLSLSLSLSLDLSLSISLCLCLS
jgi:PleD family two-component response regulator